MSGSKGAQIRERTFTFAVQVVRVCQRMDSQPGTPRVLARQLLRGATSIGANLEEAQAGQSRADFVCKIAIALKEARETNYWLRLIQASDLPPGSGVDHLQKESEEIARILAAIIVSAKKG